MEKEPEHKDPVIKLTPVFVVRSIIGGVLMGVANIIPGVSGGTMILAVGLYEYFVDSVANFTRFKFRVAEIVFLGIVGVSALIAILLSVGVINWGLTNHQHIMFALFIGLTLGGVPLLYQQLKPMNTRSVVSIVVGIAFMVFITWFLQQYNLPANFAFLFIAGIIGSAAMVLPGISGSYLLLALGLYYPVTEGISEFKDALQAMDISAAMGPAFGIMLPVGLGVLAGIAGLSNVLKWAFERAFHTTLGLLMGLLIGSVFFLYPFREPSHKDPFEAAAPITPTNIAIVLLALVLGFALTFSIDRLGKKTVTPEAQPNEA